jgi:predicted nucleotidyltransferase
MAVEQIIQQKLADIERAHGVRIVYAVESGSRAWGFASQDSDFDVRFLAVHPPEWYLTVNVEHKRDVIELPIRDNLDINGWDLRKALHLLRKSNPPLLEWLGSPIIYREHYSIARRMRAMLPLCYSPRSAMYHYVHMARSNVREYLKGERVWTKKYFYVLRPLLAVQWIERGLGVVPTEFQRLVDELVGEGELREAIDELLRAKRAGEELDEGPRIPAIHEFLDSELARLAQGLPQVEVQQCPVEALDGLFQLALQEVWK